MSARTDNTPIRTMWISADRHSLSQALSFQKVHRCEVHGYYADGIYCEACEEDPDRPHDVWGDKTIRFIVSR